MMDKTMCNRWSLRSFYRTIIRKVISTFVVVAFISTSVKSPAYAQIVDPLPRMPVPGMMVYLSPEFTPALLKGILIHPENAFKFDFIIYRGDNGLTGDQKKEEYTKLIKYFLASLAVPDEDQWVNLSPYEKDRIIKDDFGKTEMGRDLLAQDYLLKQITASLIYPQDKLGQKFWDEVYSRAYKQFGITNIPVNTFNKVWIVPDEADIYEKGNVVYLYKSHLKVMLEEDYLSLMIHQGQNAKAPQGNNSHALASQVVREIVLPQLEKEVNEGKNFAPLRQVFSGMILAAWFKRALRQSLLGKIYANKDKVKGVDQNPENNEAIYQQYLKAYKKGVFNYIKEDMDKYSNETMPRKYFSGGTALVNPDAAMGSDGQPVLPFVEKNRPGAAQEVKEDFGTGVEIDDVTATLDPAMTQIKNQGPDKVRDVIGGMNNQVDRLTHALLDAVDNGIKVKPAPDGTGNIVTVYFTTRVRDAFEDLYRYSLDHPIPRMERNLNSVVKAIGVLNAITKKKLNTFPGMLTEDERARIEHILSSLFETPVTVGMDGGYSFIVEGGQKASVLEEKIDEAMKSDSDYIGLLTIYTIISELGSLFIQPGNFHSFLMVTGLVSFFAVIIPTMMKVFNTKLDEGEVIGGASVEFIQQNVVVVPRKDGRTGSIISLERPMGPEASIGDEEWAKIKSTLIRVRRVMEGKHTFEITREDTKIEIKTNLTKASIDDRIKNLNYVSRTEAFARGILNALKSNMEITPEENGGNQVKLRITREVITAVKKYFAFLAGTQINDKKSSILPYEIHAIEEILTNVIGHPLKVTKDEEGVDLIFTTPLSEKNIRDQLDAAMKSLSPDTIIGITGIVLTLKFHFLNMNGDVMQANKVFILAGASLGLFVILNLERKAKAKTKASTTKEKDHAQINHLGGIDMNAANLHMNIKRDGKGVPLPVSQQDLAQIHIDGLVPVILTIKLASAALILSY